MRLHTCLVSSPRILHASSVGQKFIEWNRILSSVLSTTGASAGVIPNRSSSKRYPASNGCPHRNAKPSRFSRNHFVLLWTESFVEHIKLQIVRASKPLDFHPNILPVQDGAFRAQDAAFHLDVGVCRCGRPRRRGNRSSSCPARSHPEWNTRKRRALCQPRPSQKRTWGTAHG